MTSTTAEETLSSRDQPESSAIQSFPRWDPWKICCLLAAIILTALVMWPILDAGRAALDIVWRPSGDWAVLTLRVEDVGRHTPLVGPYSRFGWNHPGPLMYWLLALPYQLFGDRPESILTAAATLNALTVAGIGAVAWRRGRLPLVALTMAALAVLVHGLGPSTIRDPWNPFLTLLPLALLTFLAWSILEGDHWMWPPLAFVTSFEIQSHVGYLPMVTVVFASVLLIAWRHHSMRSLNPISRRQRLWVFAVTFAVLVGCWIPVVIDQFSQTGNLGAIFDYFLSTTDRPAGFATAFHVAADQLRLPSAPWLGRAELAGSDGALLGAGLITIVIPLVAMAVSMLVARKAKAHSVVRLQLIVIALCVAGVISTARVVGPVFDWIVRWWWVVACLWWLSIAWALWSALRTAFRSEASERVMITVTAAVASIVILAATGPVRDAAATAQPPSPSIGIVLNGFLQPTLDALQGSGPLLVVTTGSVRGDYGDALRLQLERVGIEVVAEADMVSHLGPERAESVRTATGTLWIVSAQAISQFSADPTMKFIGGWDPLTSEERRRYLEDQTLLQDQLIAVGRVDLAEALTNGGGGVDSAAEGLTGVDQDLLRRVEKIRRMGDPVAVFLGPPRSN